MSIVQLTSSQRRKLRIELRHAADASYYRSLLAILELDRGQTVTDVAASLRVTRQRLTTGFALSRPAQTRPSSKTITASVARPLGPRSYRRYG